MTTHARSPLGVAACGQRTRSFDSNYSCSKCTEASRRLRAALPKEVTHAPVAASPSGADVNAGNSIDNTAPNGVSAVTDADADRSTTGSVVAFGHAAGSTTGTCIRKWPHQHAFRFIHTLPNSRIVITKYPSPTQPAWT